MSDPEPRDESQADTGATESTSLDDEVEFKHQGPIRRNIGLLTAVAVVVLVGPAISRFIESYRGIVLELRDDEMLVAQLETPPRWMSVVGAQPGQIIAKRAGSWGPELDEVNDSDEKLTEMYDRWIDSYLGTMIEIIPPAAPGGASVAVINTDDGRQLDLALWAEHLAASREGRRVEKKPSSWDPVLLPVEE